MQAEPAAPRVRDYLLLMALAVCWGAAYMFVKIAVETVPPFTVVAARVLIGALVLLAVLGRGARALFDPALSWKAFYVQGALNAAIPWTLVAWAARFVDSSLTAILNSTSPIFVFLLTWAITRHEPATLRKLGGVLLGIAGVVTIIGIDALEHLGTSTAAELACVAGALCYAIAAIVGRRFDAMPPTLSAAGAMLAAATVLVPASLLIDQPWALRPSLASLAALVALGIVSTGVAFAIYFRLLRTVGSITTASQSYLRIIVGVTFGIVFLGERIDATTAGGLGLVLLGVVAMSLPGRARPRAR